MRFAVSPGVILLCIATSMRRLRSLAALVSLGCALSTAPGDRVVADRYALFIGNSYLYYADIPGIVEALSDSAGGERIAAQTVAGPDMALIDHWNSGTAVAAIRARAWDWIVLQQGPSSVEANRDTLRLATTLFANEIAHAGARAALFSAWPAEDRRQDFPRAIESYMLAASDVDGILLPVAGAWLLAWDADPSLGLYADGLHPSVAGAYLSALVIYARLLNRSPLGLPHRLRLRSGSTISVDSSLAVLLQHAAADAIAAAP